MNERLITLPVEILRECHRLQEKWGLPESRPAYVELVTPGKPTLFMHCKDLTVAHCEQLTEYHVRGAWNAIDRWRRTRSRKSLRTAADHVMRARLHRCDYYSRLDQAVSVNDMPFDDAWLAFNEPVRSE